MNIIWNEEAPSVIIIFTLVLVIIYLFKIAFANFIKAKHSNTFQNRINHILNFSLYRIDDTKLASKKIKTLRKQKFWEKTQLFLWFSGIMLTIFCIAFAFSLSTTAMIIMSSVYLLGLLSIFIITAQIKARRQNKFIESLPDALDLMSRAISAGHSVPEGISIVAENFTGMIGEEFQLISDNMKVGSTLHEALEDAAASINSSEFRFFTIIINVQQQTGGNVVKLLNDLSDTLRKKQATAQRIQALSAEPIASAVIIGLLPFLVIVLMSILSPTYIAPLITSNTGHMILGWCLIEQILGIMVMRRIIRIEI